MTDTSVDLSVYQGRQIKFHYTPPRNAQNETPLQVEGTVVMVNMMAGAILLKEKGTVLNRLVEISGIDLQSLELIDEPLKPLKQKELPRVTLSSARHHLLDRHGWGLAAINNLPDQEAFDIHQKMGHEDDGHVHETRE